jgi:hypothetical protein
MKNRYLVLGLSVVLALALAVPALGGPSNPVASLSASAKSVANKALKKAKTAQKKAEAAQTTANSAQSEANTANTAAGKAQTTANSALTAANSAGTAAKTAQTAADKAQTTANGAKTAADAAQTTANEAKTLGEAAFSDMTLVSGESVDGTGQTAFASAGCPSGYEPTGGGFILNGSDSAKVRVDLSTQYIGAWIVSAENVTAHNGESWELSATVNCID